MISEKENVDSVTIVEINDDVIHLFQKYIVDSSKMLIKFKLSSQTLLNMHKLTLLRVTMILYLRIYGMMFRMESTCI